MFGFDLRLGIALASNDLGKYKIALNREIRQENDPLGKEFRHDHRDREISHDRFDEKIGDTS